jgi:ubiquinone/menaquinone biosynthesis C-methylase UbiE
LRKPKTQLLKHHGGNGYQASLMIANSYDARHDRSFWRFWDESVACHYQVGDGVLDLGAGIGQFVRDCANRYPKSSVYGIDAATYMVNDAVKLPANAQILLDDLNLPQAPIAENSLAMVMANNMVHELTQPIKMFKATYQWLKPGGRFCIIDPIRQPLKQQLDKAYSHTQLWGDETSVEDLENVFEFF